MQLKSATEPQAMTSAASQSIHPFGWQNGDGKVISSWVKTGQISFCNMILWVLFLGNDLVSKRLQTFAPKKLQLICQSGPGLKQKGCEPLKRFGHGALDFELPPWSFGSWIVINYEIQTYWVPHGRWDADKGDQSKIASCWVSPGWIGKDIGYMDIIQRNKHKKKQKHTIIIYVLTVLEDVAWPVDVAEWLVQNWNYRYWDLLSPQMFWFKKKFNVKLPGESSCPAPWASGSNRIVILARCKERRVLGICLGSHGNTKHQTTVLARHVDLRSNVKFGNQPTRNGNHSIRFQPIAEAPFQIQHLRLAMIHFQSHWQNLKTCLLLPRPGTDRRSKNPALPGKGWRF